MAPWHLWGNSQQLTSVIGGIGLTTAASGQLVRINYGRPETWRFLFGLTVDKPPAATFAGTIDLFARFDLIVGIGRSVYQTFDHGGDSFCNFRISDTAANLVGRTLWTCVTRPPFPIDGVAFQPPTDTIVAQDLQCSCRLQSAAGITPVAGQPITATVHAYFAPNVHIRPEWFSDMHGDEGRFRGAEQGGT
jgi:hypothetical protein